MRVRVSIQFILVVDTWWSFRNGFTDGIGFVLFLLPLRLLPLVVAVARAVAPSAATTLKRCHCKVLWLWIFYVSSRTHLSTSPSHLYADNSLSIIEHNEIVLSLYDWIFWDCTLFIINLFARRQERSSQAEWQAWWMNPHGLGLGIQQHVKVFVVILCFGSGFERQSRLD